VLTGVASVATEQYNVGTIAESGNSSSNRTS
jgi:hypothetical protein